MVVLRNARRYVLFGGGMWLGNVTMKRTVVTSFILAATV
jgi:ribulose 1,5-bisphosphate synthetase/thiazole synthase